ncbi:Hypothetical protein NTJ_15625 [Nesidiocoris tenuis]|uniref:Uncharacterized protein n=1 Tax=Nesidiocoris tenuis TaxID=355587 RepID=A0ABN7A9C9_9HEMI|nr:Hypothetical protein NTJ_01628 [Nesidiocoris tenuis]BET02806.1 Hypothetical protein NTJ_15625 [Nesidiocoris tenuis]
MSKYQLYIVAEASTTGEKTTVLKLKRIRSASEEIWYRFPDDLQGLASHKNITELPPVKSAINSIKARGQFRTVNVIFSPEIEGCYRDDAGNFTFQNFLLSEVAAQPKEPDAAPEAGLTQLVTCLNKLIAKKDDSLNEIMKHFMVGKFSTRNKNVQAWVKEFEREVNRFSLNGPTVIEVFRLCLDQSMSDWFATAQKKLGIEADWDTWKESLISTFSDDSWTPVRFAYSFRYMTGSFVDFVVKKERLLLDLDHEIPEQIILNLIVLGLPVRIQNELSRSSVGSIRLLISKLKKFDHDSSSRRFGSMERVENRDQTPKTFETSGKLQKAPASEEKHPCPICEKGKRGTRYHPESKCWFKDTNKIKAVNNLEIETELNSKINDQKNL